MVHSFAMMARGIRFAIVAVLAAGGLAGCATVAPYERETHARADMRFDANPNVAAAEAHSTETREGSAGGFGGGGGGCGCN
jgi:hypothetical protein